MTFSLELIIYFLSILYIYIYIAWLISIHIISNFFCYFKSLDATKFVQSYHMLIYSC